MASERERELAWVARRIHDLDLDARRCQTTATRLGLVEVAEHLGNAIGSVEMASDYVHDVEVALPKEPT